jgi:hypothetical protein
MVVANFDRGCEIKKMDMEVGEQLVLAEKRYSRPTSVVHLEVARTLTVVSVKGLGQSPKLRRARINRLYFNAKLLLRTPNTC